MSGKHIALLVGSLKFGGAERTFVTLARAFAARGHRVDLVLSKRRGPLLAEVPAAVRVVVLGAPRTLRALPALLRLPADTWRYLPPILAQNRPKVVGSLPALVHYLRTAQPDALLATLDPVNVVAAWAKRLAHVDTRVVVREGTTLSAAVRNSANAFKRRLPELAGRWYPRADAIVSVSDGVADDLARTAGIARARIVTIHNPVDLRRVGAKAAAPLDDPWLRPGQAPLLVAAGRLEGPKDYPTLLRALALVRAEREVRLVVLGDGPLRQRLAALCRELGLADAVRLAGFAENPYAYMARARALVLSSAWEGFPNVLIEALACGCPVVSTDCPHGPAELLAQGRYGKLVPVGDAEALARGILATLRTPPQAARLRERAAAFSVDAVAEQYLRVLVGEAAGACDPSE